MHDAFVVREMRGGMFAPAIHAELVPWTGQCLAVPRPFIAGIAPHPRGLGFAGLASSLHLDRGIVGEERRFRPHLLASVIGQGRQECQERIDPRRMSVTPTASQTRVLLGTGIKPTGPAQG